MTIDLRLLLLAASLSAFAAGAQSDSPRPQLEPILNTPQYQWVFNHICVPTKLLSAAAYTNTDFVETYFAVSEARWNASIEAQQRGDQDASMKSLALILHGVIDSYWPNRLTRDPSGAITQFRDCEEMGNLQGMLHEERSGTGPPGEVKEQTTKLIAQIIGKWKEGRPFSEVAPILQSGPMKLSESHAQSRLGAQ